MDISTRNQFTGTVVAVKEGAVNGVVTIDLGETLIKAGVTMESIHKLGLTEGSRATAIVKATNVLVAPGTDRLAVSAHNQFPGTIARVVRGAVNGLVTVTTEGGLALTGSITNEAIDELGLAEGACAVAVVNSTDVLVAVPE